MLYRMVRLIVSFIVRLVARVEYHGLENVPPEGSSFAIASNHLGRLDAVLIYNFTSRPDVIMLAAEKYQKVLLARWFGKALKVIWVDRFNADFSAMREALHRLKRGGVLVLAPEGTRSPTGALIEGRPGISYLAAKAGVPILPVAVVGTEDRQVYGAVKRLRRVKVDVNIGPAFMLPPLALRDRDVQLRTCTDEIMCRIAAMLPPEKRGVYADHPRLQELLNAPTDQFDGGS